MPRTVLDLTEEEFERAMSTKVRPIFLMYKYAIPSIPKRSVAYFGVHSSIADFTNKIHYKPEGRLLFIAGSLDEELDRQRIDFDMCPSEEAREFMTSFSEVISKRMPCKKKDVWHSSLGHLRLAIKRYYLILDFFGDFLHFL